MRACASRAALVRLRPAARLSTLGKLRGLSTTPGSGIKLRDLSTAAPAAPGPSTDAAPPAAASPSLRELPSIYLELSKSRLSGLVVLTTGAGAVMGPHLDAPTLAAALGGTFLCAASANSFNQVIEKDLDAQMNRTCRRPLPSGRISRTHAAAWASFAGVAGVGTLAAGTNLLTAGLGASTLGLYTLVYTPMKQEHWLNTWVGAVVGALPPVMGWTAAGGALLAPEAAVLGGALFIWQIPHFLALAWMYRKDYAQAGYKMLPLGDPTGERTARACLEYSVYLAALPPACWALGLSSCMFPLEGLVFNAPMVFLAWRFARTPERGQAHARRLFLASLAYLPLFFGCLLLHQRRKAPAAAEEEADAPLALATADVGEEEITAAYAAKQAELKARGREYCVHEHPELTSELQPSAPLRVLMGVGLALCPNPPLSGGADAARDPAQQQPQQQPQR